MGLYHSGLEISGREYSYGSGGSGIFESSPRDAPGARFRCQVDLGSFDGGTKELNQALDDLRSSGGFGSNGYHLVKRNCNHFCNALSWRLLRKPIPAYVNRLADIGNCCSCLLPKQLLEDSPVGGGEAGAQSFVVPTRGSMSRGANVGGSAFSGKGHSLGGQSTSSTSNSSESEGLLSKFTLGTTTPPSTTPKDDLTDRREKARKAALARLERNQQQSSSDKQS